MALQLDVAGGEKVSIGEDISVKVIRKESGGKAVLQLELPADSKMMMRFGDDIRVAVKRKTGRRVCMSFSAPRNIEIDRQRAGDPEKHVAHEGLTDLSGGSHGTYDCGSG